MADVLELYHKFENVSAAMQKLKTAYDKACTNISEDDFKTTQSCRPIAWSDAVDCLMHGGDSYKASLDFFRCTLNDPALLALCGGDAAKTDADFLIGFTTEFTEVSELSARCLSKEVVDGDKLLKLAHALDKLDTSSKSVAALYDKDLRVAYDLLTTHARATVEQSWQPMIDACSKWVTTLHGQLHTKAKQLDKIAGGGDKCKSWYAGAPASVKTKDDDFFEFTRGAVDKVKAQTIQPLMVQTAQAHAPNHSQSTINKWVGLSGTRSYLSPYAPPSPLPPFPHHHLQSLTAANTTRHHLQTELPCCLCLTAIA